MVYQGSYSRQGLLLRFTGYTRRLGRCSLCAPCGLSEVSQLALTACSGSRVDPSRTKMVSFSKTGHMRHQNEQHCLGIDCECFQSRQQPVYVPHGHFLRVGQLQAIVVPQRIYHVTRTRSVGMCHRLGCRLYGRLVSGDSPQHNFEQHSQSTASSSCCR
jgi:hypothetical protein